MFKVTEKWIMENASYHGPRGNAWKRVQVEAIGVSHPLKSGWIQRAEGTEITEENRKRFELFKDTAKREKQSTQKRDPATAPDWTGNCLICGESPIVPATGMCGPCTFGEAETVGGNW